MARQARGELIDPNKIQMVHVFNHGVRWAFFAASGSSKLKMRMALKLSFDGPLGCCRGTGF